MDVTLLLVSTSPTVVGSLTAVEMLVFSPPVNAALDPGELSPEPRIGTVLKYNNVEWCHVIAP